MLKKIYVMALVLTLFTLTACFSPTGWQNELQANPASDPGHAFVNVHVTNTFDHGVMFTLEGFELYEEGEWIKIPLNPDHDVEYLMISSEIGTGEDNRITSSTAGFDHYLNPNYPTTGTFRLVGRLEDLSGDYLKTLTSNKFEIENFSFEEE